MSVGDLSFAFNPQIGETPQTIAQKRAIANAILGNTSHAPRDIGEGLNSIGQALMYRQMMKGVNKAEAEGNSGAAKVFGSLFGDQFPAAPAAPQGSGAPVVAPKQADNANAPSADVASSAPDAGGDVESYIRQAAASRGIDPDVAVKVASGEGGLHDPYRRGEGPAPRSQAPGLGATENSFGPLQLYVSGTGAGLGDRAVAAGIDPRKNWKGGVDFALDEAAKKGWGQWYGAKAQGITGMMGIGQAPAQSPAVGAVNAMAAGQMPLPQQAPVPLPNPMMADNGAPTQVASLDPSAGMPPAPSGMVAPPQGAPQPLLPIQSATPPQPAAMPPAGIDPSILAAAAAQSGQQPAPSPDVVNAGLWPRGGQSVLDAMQNKAPMGGDQPMPMMPGAGPLTAPDAAQQGASQRIAAALMQGQPLGGSPAQAAQIDAKSAVANAMADQQARRTPPASPIGPFPGMLEQGNIDLAQRPIVHNPDGSYSTVRSMSFENNGGQEILVPTVSPDGKILSNRDAMKLYGTTGQNLGKFDNPAHADMYAEALHKAQEQHYGAAAQHGPQPGPDAQGGLDPQTTQAAPLPPPTTVQDRPVAGAPAPDLSQIPAMAGGNSDVIAPGEQQGPSIQQLMQAAADPFVMQKYGPMVEALLTQKMKQGDPSYALDIADKKLKLQLEQQQLGGNFRGDSMDAQAWNILQTADPTSKQYATAYSIVSQPKTQLVQTANGLVPVQVPPQLPGWLKAPGEMGAAPGAPGAAPAAAGTAPNASGGPANASTAIPGTKQPATEMQARNGAIGKILLNEVPTLGANFSALADPKGQLLNALPGGIGNAWQSPQYQQAANAVKASVSNVLYSLSGASSNPGEVLNQIGILTPAFGDSPATINDKLQRFKTYVRAISSEANDPELSKNVEDAIGKMDAPATPTGGKNPASGSDADPLGLRK